jgi:hypothetical protein
VVQRCVEAFTIWRAGVPITFTPGQLVEDKHAILKTHRHLFQDVATAAQPRQAQHIEAAVNDPGTARDLTPPAATTQTGADDQAPAFNPDDHSNREVIEYLGTADEAETLRVLEAEAAGQNRAGIVKAGDKLLEDARARDRAE